MLFDENEEQKSCDYTSGDSKGIVSQEIGCGEFYLFDYWIWEFLGVRADYFDLMGFYVGLYLEGIRQVKGEQFYCVGAVGQGCVDFCFSGCVDGNC